MRRADRARDRVARGGGRGGHGGRQGHDDAVIGENRFHFRPAAAPSYRDRKAVLRDRFAPRVTRYRRVFGAAILCTLFASCADRPEGPDSGGVADPDRPAGGPIFLAADDLSDIESRDLYVEGATLHGLVAGVTEAGSRAVYYLRSPDGSRTWSDPVTVSQPTAPSVSARHGNDVQIAAADPTSSRPGRSRRGCPASGNSPPRFHAMGGRPGSRDPTRPETQRISIRATWTSPRIATETFTSCGWTTAPRPGGIRESTTPARWMVASIGRPRRRSIRRAAPAAGWRSRARRTGPSRSCTGTMRRTTWRFCAPPTAVSGGGARDRSERSDGSSRAARTPVAHW